MVREKLSKEALEKQSKKTTTTHDKLSLDTLDMGFNTGGKIIIIPLLQVVVCACVLIYRLYFEINVITTSKYSRKAHGILSNSEFLLKTFF